MIVYALCCWPFCVRQDPATGVSYRDTRSSALKTQRQVFRWNPFQSWGIMGMLVRLALFVLVLLACCVLLGPLAVPIAEVRGTVPVEQLADPDSLFVDIDGLLVHYKVVDGEGPAIVLLHGFAASVFSWRKVMSPLGEMGTVVAFDRPAFGLTDRPMPGEWGDENPYSPEAQAELTVALMDELGLEKAVLVGHSAGGSVALLTALTYPDRVEALVLEDASVYENSGTPEWMRPLLRTRPMGRLGPLFVRTITLWGEAAIRAAWDDPDKITVELISGYKRPLEAENWDKALWELVLASHPLDLEKRLAEVSVPTLVITGERDRIVATGNSERLAGELPGSQLVVIPDCGHVPHEECPDLFLEAVTGFLAELS